MSHAGQATDTTNATRTGSEVLTCVCWTGRCVEKIKINLINEAKPCFISVFMFTVSLLEHCLDHNGKSKRDCLDWSNPLYDGWPVPELPIMGTIQNYKMHYDIGYVDQNYIF